MVPIIAISILLLNILIGYKRGMIKTVFSICSVIVAIFLAIWISPYIANWMQKNESIMNFFIEKTNNIMELEEVDLSASDLTWIEALPLPESIQKSVKDTIESLLIEDNSSEDVISKNELSSKQKKLDQSLRKHFAIFMIKAVAFVISFFVCCIFLYIISKVLNLISYLPIVHQVNQLLGLVCGLIQGFLVLWILCIVLTPFSGTEFGLQIMKEVSENSFLSFIYNNNLLLKLIS